MTYFALRITNPEVAEIAFAIDPSLNGKHYESQVRDHVLLIGFPSPGRTTLIMPSIFAKHFERANDGKDVILQAVNKIPQPEDDPLRKTPFIQH